jgi:hypothetical protein
MIEAMYRANMYGVVCFGNLYRVLRGETSSTMAVIQDSGQLTSSQDISPAFRPVGALHLIHC